MHALLFRNNMLKSYKREGDTMPREILRPTPGGALLTKEVVDETGIAAKEVTEARKET